MEVTRLPDIDNERFQASFRNIKPLILTETAKNWPAMEKWKDPQYLSELIGNKYSDLLPVFTSKDNKHFLAKEKVDVVDMTFNQLMDKVFKPTNEVKYYLRGKIYPEISEDIVYPKFLLNSKSNEKFSDALSGIWIGSAGNITPLHIDIWHGLLIQVLGRKSIVLYSPEDTNYLYPYNSLSQNSHTSRIDLCTIEKEMDKFPKFAEATAYKTVLEPGEMMYIPPCWWHDVISLDDCISVTCRWNIGAYESIHPCALK
eukprot:TRINITY_DN28097_c0_g1_i1.p1 TRINITY_DN28097_c0_g1~~TRINITY_DN28097_c0_g1_i1.p1  ORF type:complete len:271 (-),score=49.73 TRINITY_DN28097_c0_g1_i1:50-820(-)